MHDIYGILVFGILGHYVLIRLYIVAPKYRKSYLQSWSMLGLMISLLIIDLNSQMRIYAYFLAAIFTIIMVLSFASNTPKSVLRFFRILGSYKGCKKTTKKMIDIWIAGILCVVILFLLVLY